jgi:hypothetical protein
MTFARSAVLLSACIFAAAAAPAEAADSCVNTAGSGGCFATIAAAIADPGTVDGDTITVASGTYNEDQLLVTKGVTIVGAGMGKTVIDGNRATLASAGTVRLSGSADQTLRNLTIRDAGGVSPSTRIAVAIKTAAPAKVLLDGVEVLGRGTGGGDYGIDADHSGADIEIADGRVTDTAFNPILIERGLGATDIHGNVITAPFSVFFMSHSGDAIATPQRIHDNQIVSAGSGIGVTGAFTGPSVGSFSDFQITGNDIVSGGGSAIGLTNASTSASGVEGQLSDFVIADNRLTSSATAPVAASRGVNISGAVTDAQITGNTITGFETGIRAVNPAAGHSQSGTAAHFNRIAGNTTPVLNSSSNPIDAEHNWWGCNAGPGNADCGTLGGASATDASPWLVLRVAAAPASIETGGNTSSITADLTRDSDGATPASNSFPDATPIGFATTLGTLGQASLGTTSASAATTLTSGATAGTATVTSTLDKQSVTTPVAFTAPLVTTTPADTNTGGTTTGGGGLQPTTPGQVAPPPAGSLSLRAVKTVKIDRLGRFTLTADTAPSGVLVARGTAKASGVAKRRLVGKRQHVGSGPVKVQLRLARATRLALVRGRRVTATVTMTLTPPREGAAATKTITGVLTR